MTKPISGQKRQEVPTREEMAAKLFRGLGDRTRLRILMLLKEGDRSVGDLTWQLGLSQGRVSVHLSCLNDCGLVTSYRQGKKVYFRISDDRVWQVLELGWQRIVSHTQGILNCSLTR